MVHQHPITTAKHHAIILARSAGQRIRNASASRKIAIFVIASLLLAISTFSNENPAFYPVRAIFREPRKFCDQTTLCIFDVGHNNGQDSASYLSSSTSPADVRVVAVEANPTLVKGSRVRFADQLSSGQLELLLTGISTDAKSNISFWVNNFNDHFSSFHQAVGCRNQSGVAPDLASMDSDALSKLPCTEISVPTITCTNLLEKYGVPYYFKIDIEGMDLTCAQSLRTIPKHKRSKYISVEGVGESTLEIFKSLGYDKYKIVNQWRLSHDLLPDMNGNSGPWGEDAEDYEEGKKWLSMDTIVKRLPSLPIYETYKHLNAAVWYDTHGKLWD